MVWAALVDLNQSGHYLHWGFVQLSLANALVVLVMVVLFVVVLLVPFGPGRHQR